MPFIELQTVDSTNNYALAQVRSGLAQHGWVVFAHEQYAGKGQMGKKWAGEKGANIALSVVIKPESLGISQQFHLSACMAVAVHSFFNKYAGSATRIKWPNDLYWNDKKAGGILIENIVGSSDSAVGSQELGNWQWSIVGIGININQTQFPGDLPNPVSLKQITGKYFDPVELSRELCLGINRYYNMLISEGFEAILPLYLSEFYKIGEKVRLKKESRVFDAVIKGIAQDGKLIVEHNLEEQFAVGEVQWLIG